MGVRQYIMWKSSSRYGWADSNINIQMNYWFAELTAMDVVTPLFDYFEVCNFPQYSVGVGVTHTCLIENMGASRLANSAGPV